MIFYLGHEAIVTLRNGDTLRGRLAWSWAWGHHRLTGVTLLGPDEPVQMAGAALIPTSSVAAMQVM